MSKHGQLDQAGENFEFDEGQPSHPINQLGLSEDNEFSQQDSNFLDDAHDALSKLFSKTNKRAKQLRGVRRKDAWQ